MHIPSLSPGQLRAERVRSAVTRNHTNATAQWGGEPVPVIFSRKSFAALGEFGGYDATCRVLLSALPGIQQGALLSIDGMDWQVAEPVQADDTGWVVLQLREVNHG